MSTQQRQQQPHKRCEYVLDRGPNQGQVCGRGTKVPTDDPDQALCSKHVAQVSSVPRARKYETLCTVVLQHGPRTGEPCRKAYCDHRRRNVRKYDQPDVCQFPLTRGARKGQPCNKKNCGQHQGRRQSAYTATKQYWLQQAQPRHDIEVVKVYTPLPRGCAVAYDYTRDEMVLEHAFATAIDQWPAPGLAQLDATVRQVVAGLPDGFSRRFCLTAMTADDCARYERGEGPRWRGRLYGFVRAELDRLDQQTASPGIPEEEYQRMQRSILDMYRLFKHALGATAPPPATPTTPPPPPLSPPPQLFPEEPPPAPVVEDEEPPPAPPPPPPPAVEEEEPSPPPPPAVEQEEPSPPPPPPAVDKLSVHPAPPEPRRKRTISASMHSPPRGAKRRGVDIQAVLARNGLEPWQVDEMCRKCDTSEWSLELAQKITPEVFAQTFPDSVPPASGARTSATTAAAAASTNSVFDYTPYEDEIEQAFTDTFHALENDPLSLVALPALAAAVQDTIAKLPAGFDRRRYNQPPAATGDPSLAATVKWRGTIRDTVTKKLHEIERRLNRAHKADEFKIYQEQIRFIESTRRFACGFAQK
jgi:hypothetical protein